MAFDNQSLPGTIAQPRVEIRPLLRQVYRWMALGLLLTATVSLLVVNIPALTQLVLNPIVFFGAIIGELVLVIALSARIQKMSATTATTMFMVYAGVNGFTLSIIFFAYELGSIGLAFGTAAILFGVMSVIGMTTNIDLQKYSSYFMMAVIGLVIAMVLNIFLASGPLDFIISAAGVLIFTALTAYDTQKLYRMAADPEITGQGEALLSKLSIMGALRLYLDFINLFLFLLRLMGGRR